MGEGVPIESTQFFSSPLLTPTERVGGADRPTNVKYYSLSLENAVGQRPRTTWRLRRLRRRLLGVWDISTGNAPDVNSEHFLLIKGGRQRRP